MNRRQALRTLGGAGLAGLLAGCTQVAEVSSRNLSPGVVPVAARNYRVVRLGVTVPDALKVSDANLFYPPGDIVWREEPYGDRRAQVERIVREAAMTAVNPLRGGRAVAVAIQVARFHALSEKARVTVGGVHELRYWLTVTDVRTGEVVEGPRFVIADIRGFGGAAAFAAQRTGQTQRVRIVDALTRSIRDELTDGRSAVA